MADEEGPGVHKMELGQILLELLYPGEAGVRDSGIKTEKNPVDSKTTCRKNLWQHKHLQ